uniref:Rab9 effector protein with kelch motifs n=1 Tax=Anolis carolinensis TaxID=28377 RepID=H9G8E9_ANOCA
MLILLHGKIRYPLKIRPSTSLGAKTNIRHCLIFGETWYISFAVSYYVFVSIIIIMMMMYNIQKTGTWEKPEVRGVPPSVRTFHTSTAAIGDRLYVFGGGDKGADPVQDQQLHIFDSATLTWLQPEVSGQAPTPRHGHVMVAVGNRLFVHGGLASDTFYGDLFSIDITKMKWETLPATGSVPGGRAAHSAVAFRDHLYIFGGMDPTGALDTMYKYHIEKGHWTQLEFKTALPAGRLDHSMCIIPWEAPSSESSGLTHLCLIFGGMDMKGEIYGDCVVCVLE